MLHFGMNMPVYFMVIYGSIMIVMIFILRVLFKNRLPKFVFPVLWGVVLLRFLIPFSISSPISMPVPLNRYVPYVKVGQSVTMVANNEATESDMILLPGTTYISQESISSVAETTHTYQSGRKPFFTYSSWKKMKPAIYILGLLAVLGILGWQKYGYVKKLRKGFLIEHNETVNSILRSMGMGHVLVFTNDEIASPLVCGLLNPRIYLPTRMDFQNVILLRHVLVHEAMHIRRKDNWMKGVLLIVLCLYWYNPLVWLMAACLVSDLEAACDAAVLRICGEEERKDYASSLLTMALSGRRTALLYSAFSKTEVEKRVKNVLHYKKVTIFVLLFTILFMAGSMVTFAAVGQAPFIEDFTSFCALSNSRWGVKVTLNRDIALGEKAQERAEAVIFSVLRADDTNDPKIIEEHIRASLAEEFGVEKGAFHIMIQLCLDEEMLKEEYAAWGLTRAEDGYWLYQEDTIRTYEDKMLGYYQSKDDGVVDISVQRDALGEIIDVAVWRQGDPQFDERTRRIEEYRLYSYETVVGETFQVVEDKVVSDYQK